ncbi:TadE family type IV pilus minor pilin [Pseudarthrobacter oxydans]|uniref:TadE family type IV pilus minor pilin n=1 Tax=Pseudarthrobacter oxydans TaxID=1671 RepID=UPI003D2A96BA
MTGRHVAGSCGAVTAEFAVTLPAVLLLLAMLLAGAAAGVTQLRLEEGARAGARALARGDDSAAVERIVRTLSGASASAVIAAEGEWLSVTVTDRVGGPLGASFPWTLTATASTRSETATALPRRPNHWGTHGGRAAGQLHVRLAGGAGAGAG